MDDRHAADVIDFMNGADMSALRNPPLFGKTSLKAKPKPRVNGKVVHVALYMAKFGYGDTDFIPSELSGEKAIDVHHIICRGSGSSKGKDRIENLVALSREEHMEYGDKKQYMRFLFASHKQFMESHGVSFDVSWIDSQIEKHSGDE